MCLFSHEWKVKSTEDIDPLVIYYGNAPPWTNGTDIPSSWMERKLRVLRECATCGEQEVKILRVDP